MQKLPLLLAFAFLIAASAFAISSNSWLFEEAIVVDVGVDGDTTFFKIEANNSVQSVRCKTTVATGSACSAIKIGLIATFSGSFPAIDEDDQSLKLEQLVLVP